MAQESFYQGVSRAAFIRGDSAFLRLYRIAINTARTTWSRWEGGAERRPVSTTREAEVSRTPSNCAIRRHQDGLHGKQIANTVNKAMDALPEDLRTAITLREIEGLSYEEIANVMNCPIGTVRSRIFRAREAIAAELRPLLGTDKDRRW